MTATTSDPDIIHVVGFDPKLRTYLFLMAAGIGFMTVIGLALFPLTLWFAWWWSGHYYATLRCELTTKRLRHGYGILFRTEKTIPLDRIQDMALVRGPILDWLGLCKLKVETAGGGGSSGGLDTGAATLIGVVDAVAFQELVLRERDRVAERGLGGGTDPAGGPGPDTAGLLADIAETLRRIEKRLPEVPATGR